MIITISGNPGSGKSTIAKIIVEKLGYERIYAGGIMRSWAKEQNITIEELMRIAKTDTKIDQEVDYRVRDQARSLSQNGKNVLVEGRVQFYHLPESIKIYVKVNPYEGAKRIYQDLQHSLTNQQRNQEKVDSIEEMIKKNEEREEGDAKRYLKLYGVDHRNEKNYNFIVDTTNISALEAADKVIKYLKNQAKAYKST